MSAYTHAVVIPTMAEYDILINSVPRLFQFAKEGSLILFSFNPKDPKKAKRTENMIKFFYEQCYDDDGNQPKFDYDIIHSDKPLGFGEAVNKGLEFLKETHGYPEYVTICNDDVDATSEWMDLLESAFTTDKFTTMSKLSLSKPKGEDPHIPISELGGKIGISAPISNGVFNDQRALNKELFNALGIDGYSDKSKIDNAGSYIPTSFLSGFCFCMSKECLEDLMESEKLFDPRFKIGGYEDDDLMYRALSTGWKSVIVPACFVGHRISQTMQKHFKDQQSGLANAIEFYLKWEDETQKEKKVIGAYRTSLKTVNDVGQFRQSIMRASQIIDGFSIVLTNNPAEVLTSYDGQYIEHLPPLDKDFIRSCAILKGDMKEVKPKLEKMFSQWITKMLHGTGMEVAIEVWDGEFNERDERNLTHKLAEDLGADWIMAIDSDEVFEDRLTRQHMQRIISHPNPHRILFSTAFINHWESLRLCRTDMHYGSQTGFRLWKSFPNAHRIVAGNDKGFHCGNTPEFGNYGKRMCSLRMRHLSHVRGIDRLKKFEFYTEVDQDKRKELIGADDYSHIIKNDHVEVSIYNPKNGLGFFMLCYEKENWVNITNWLDQMYGMADRISLVWTGEWSDEDKEWASNPELLKNMSKEEFESKYKTGACWELAQASRLYKVEWLHTPFTEELGLAHCRNSALEYFYQTNQSLSNNTLGWSLFFDPDELSQDYINFGILLNKCLATTDHAGYMFKFVNPVTNGGRNSMTSSESVRLVKNTAELRMSGRVHETFEDVFAKLKNSGMHPNVATLNHVFINRGLSLSPDEMAVKLTKYSNMLINQLKENPYNSGAWVSLALQYMNDDQMQKAEECFERAIACSGTAFLPYKEYALFLLRKAKHMLGECGVRMNGRAPFMKQCVQMHNTIDDWKIDLPKVNTNGINISEDIPLPDFPTLEEWKAKHENTGNKKTKSKKAKKASK